MTGTGKGRPRRRKPDPAPIVLHIGLHRCGSTAIQNALGDARMPLREAGWKVMRRRSLSASPSLRPLMTLHNVGRIRGHFDVKQLATALDAEPKGLVISEENLPGPMPGVKGVCDFYPGFDRFAEGLAQIELRLHRPFLVRLVTRPHPDWWQSVYAFRVFKGYEGSYEEFMAAHPDADRADPEALAERLSAAGLQNVLAVDLKALMHGKGEAIASFLGLPQTEQVVAALHPKHINQSLRGDGMAAWLELLRTGRLPADERERVALRERLMGED